MKTLVRIGIILLAALIVTGVFYGLSQTSFGQSLISGGEGRGPGGEGLEMAEGAEAAEGFAGRPERGEDEGFRGGEGRGEREGRAGGLPTETIGHLIAISLITAGVVALTWLSDKIRGMLRRKAAPPAEEVAPSAS